MQSQTSPLSSKRYPENKEYVTRTSHYTKGGSILAITYTLSFIYIARKTQAKTGDNLYIYTTIYSITADLLLLRGSKLSYC